MGKTRKKNDLVASKTTASTMEDATEDNLPLDEVLLKRGLSRKYKTGKELDSSDW
jgi:hypothetical protein